MKRRFAMFVGIALVSVMTLAGFGTAQSNRNAFNDPSVTGNARDANPVFSYTPKKKTGFIVGFSNGYFGNTWRAQYVDDAQKAAAPFQKSGVVKKFIVQNTNGVPAQIAAIQSLINEGVDALIINPASSSAIAPVVAKAIHQGILVVIDDDPATYPNTINVTGDNYNFWKIQTSWIATQLHGKGDIVWITGLPGNSADELRQEAATSVLSKYPGIKILGKVPGGWDETKAQSAMSTLLAAYKNIDGVLEQDVMGQGVIQAYVANKRPIPTMTGDYTYGFLREWHDKYPNLNTMTVPYAPGVAANGVGVTIRLLQGYKLKPSAFSPNPLDPSLHNTILSPAPYVVTKNAEPHAPWMKGVDPRTKAISLAEALKIGHGQPDSAALDAYWSTQQLDALFYPKK